LRVAPEEVGAIVFIRGGTCTPRARAFIEGLGAPCLEKPIDARQLREIVRQHRRV
jgi:hypothetical protein